MNQLLKINTDLSNSNKNIAKILLDDDYESFELYTGDWEIKDYIKQWKNAATISLENRMTTAFFKNYEKESPSGIKILCLYTIVPEELAYSERFINEIGRYFYIKESFVFVTEKIALLEDDNSYEIIKECYDNYFPIYLLNTKKLDRFYLYLSNQVEGISNWKITTEDLMSVLNCL